MLLFISLSSRELGNRVHGSRTLSPGARAGQWALRCGEHFALALCWLTAYTSWCTNDHPSWPGSQRPTGLDNPRVPSSPALAAVHSSRGSGGMPRMDDELHIAVEEVEEADKLAETLPRVGRIEQPI